MGRFYKTDSATPIDYMYRINEPLMEKVLTKSDQGITNTLAQVGEPLSYNHIGTPEEDADANKIIAGYNTRMDDITKNVLADPANWTKQLDPVRGLKRDLQTDFSTGAISKQIANYQRRKSIFDDLDKRVELYHTSGGEKGLDPRAAQLAKAKWDSQFTKTGYDPNNPSAYNTYKGGTLMDEMNIQKMMTEGMDKMKADKRYSVITRPGQNPMYLDKETNKIEEITPEKIISLGMSKVTPQMVQYLKERSDLGLISNAFDENGKLLSPYSNNPIPQTAQESKDMNALQATIDKTKDASKRADLQEQLDNMKSTVANRRQMTPNDSSYLGNILRGAVDQYARSDQEVGSELSGNPVGIAQFNQGQENYRQGRSLGQQLAIHNDTQRRLQFNADRAYGLAAGKEANAKALADRNFTEKVREFDAGLGEKQREFDNPHTTGTKAGLTGTKTATAAPAETTTSELSTNSFEAKMTKDKNGIDVKEYSNAGLVGDIENNKLRLGQINKDTKAINDWLSNNSNDPSQANAVSIYKNRLADLELEKQQVNSTLNTKRDIYAKTKNLVLNKDPQSGVSLTDEDLKTYNKFETDRSGEKMRAQIEAMRAKHPNVDGPAVSAGEGGKGTVAKVSSPQVAKLEDELYNYKKIKNRVDQGMENVMTNMRKTFITSNAIAPNKKEGDEVAGMIKQNPQGLEIYNKNGDKLEGVKSGGFLGIGSTKYKMDFSGGDDLSEYMDKNGVTMNVQQIGSSTNIGKGNAVIKVTFNDSKGNLPSGEPFYIVANPSLQRDLSTKFSASKNSSVKKVATDLGDTEMNSVKKQMYNVAQDGTGTVVMVNDKGNNVTLKVHHLDDGRYNVADQNNNPMPRADKNGQDGVFDSVEDFIENYRVARQATAQKRALLEQAGQASK